MGTFAEDDVFVVGYPKSGNTWVQNLVAGLVYRMDLSCSPDVLIQDLVPDVHYKNYYNRYSTPTYFKSHFLPRPEYRRVVYLLRDGRDAMVSYLHYRAGMEGKPPDFLRMVRNGEGLEYGRWHEHVQAWLSNPYNARLIVMKYEELLANPVNELRRFCDFAKIDTNDSILQEVARKASFGEMRAREARFGMVGWDSGRSFFVRRGQTGSHKDEMPPDVMAVFMGEAHDTLAQCGYL